VTPNETYQYDPDGRPANVTSSLYGALQDVYDADGRLTSVVEPTSGGVTDAATITYGYYADGKRSAVSVTSATFTQNNALTYDYRTDGLIKTENVAAFGTGTWSRSYTNGGRLTGVSGADSQSRTYDSAGHLSQYADDPHAVKMRDALKGALKRSNKAAERGNASLSERIAEVYNDAIQRLEKTGADIQKALTGRTSGGNETLRFPERIEPGVRVNPEVMPEPVPIEIPIP